MWRLTQVAQWKRDEKLLLLTWMARSCSEPPVRGLRHKDIAFLRCLVIQETIQKFAHRRSCGFFRFIELQHRRSEDNRQIHMQSSRYVSWKDTSNHRNLKWCEVFDFQSSGWFSFYFCWPHFSKHDMQPVSYSYWVWAHPKNKTDDLLPPPGHESIINQLKSRSRLFGCNTRLNLLDDSSHDPGVVDKLVNNRRPESSLGRSLDFSGVGGKPIDMLAQEGLLDFLVNIEHEFQLLLCMSRGFWLHPPSRSLFFHS